MRAIKRQRCDIHRCDSDTCDVLPDFTHTGHVGKRRATFILSGKRITVTFNTKHGDKHIYLPYSDVVRMFVRSPTYMAIVFKTPRAIMPNMVRKKTTMPIHVEGDMARQLHFMLPVHDKLTWTPLRCGRFDMGMGDGFMAMWPVGGTDFSYHDIDDLEVVAAQRTRGGMATGDLVLFYKDMERFPECIEYMPHDDIEIVGAKLDDRGCTLIDMGPDPLPLTALYKQRNECASWTDMLTGLLRELSQPDADSADSASEWDGSDIDDDDGSDIEVDDGSAAATDGSDDDSDDH